MQIQIQGTQLDLTPAIKQYIEDKIGGLAKFVSRYEEQGEILARVEIARTTQHHMKGEVYYAEVTMHVPGKTMRAEHTDHDIRVSIDRVKAQLKNDLVKYKEKQVDRDQR